MDAVTKDTLKRYKLKEKNLFKNMELDTLGCLVDDGVKSNAAEKKAKGDLALIKPVLLAYAIERKEKRLSGFQGLAKITKKTSSFIAPKDLLQYLIKCDKKKLFYDLIKVGITDAKKFLGEEALKDIIKVETKEYGSVSFKENKS